MKLFEIINPAVRTVTDNNYDPFSRNNNKIIGSGAYSFVYDKNDDTDPNTIIKRNKTNNEDDLDGFVVYAQEIYEKELWNNPHFPRIYKTKNILSNGKTWVEWEIEKLHETDDIDRNLTDALVEKYFDTSNPDIEKFIERNKSFNKINIIIRNILNNTSFGIEVIKDETLLKAINILIDMKKKKNLAFDIHSGNIMFRYSGSGGEIVFTDPFV